MSINMIREIRTDEQRRRDRFQLSFCSLSAHLKKKKKQSMAQFELAHSCHSCDRCGLSNAEHMSTQLVGEVEV